jgi:tetratricopeptide (TPR) repeat protein
MRIRILIPSILCGLAAWMIAITAVAQVIPPAGGPPSSPGQPPVQEPAVLEETPLLAPAEKFGQYEILWRERLQAVAQKQEDQASEILGRIRQQATQDGVRNLDVIASALVREALKAATAAPGLVSSRFEAAKQMAPDLPSVYLAEGWVLLGRGPGSYAGALRAYAAAYQAGKRDFWTALNWLGALVVIGLGTVLSVLLVYALVMQICYLPKLYHHLGEVMGDKVPPLVLQFGLGLALLLPFFIRVGMGWGAISWLALVWLYMTTRERVVALAMILIVGMGGLAMPYVVAAFKPADSPLLATMVREYRGEAIPGFADAPEPGEPEAWRVHSIRGLFFQRTGYAEEARREYDQALALNPRALPVWINLGSLQYRGGRYPESIKTYRQALQINPRSFEAHFNLAQAYRENLQFNEGTASLEEAKRINPRLTEKQTQQGLNDPRYQVLQIGIEPADLWREAFTLTPTKEADGHALLRTYLGIGPLGAGPAGAQALAAVTVVVGFALGLISFVKIGEWMPFACQLCGRMICRKCQLLFTQKKVCTDCWEKAKRGHFHEKDAPQAPAPGSLRVPLVLGVIPGAPDLYTRNTVTGVITMTAFFAGSWGLVAGYALMGPPVAIPTVAASFAPGLLLAVCMVMGSYLRTLRQAFTIQRLKK